MLRFFYNIFIVPIAFLGMFVLSLFSKKIYTAIKERTNIIKKLSNEIANLGPFKKTVLFHVSSMGEFKQIIPIIERFNKEREKYNLVISVFSSSAYKNISKDESDLVDIISYVPFDTYFITKNFISFINPSLVIISKHDVWPNFILELSRRDTPIYLVNALYAKDSKVGNWYVKPFFKSLYKHFTGIITIDKSNRDRFFNIYPYDEKLHICGDSRFDTVKKDAVHFSENDPFGEFRVSKKIFVAGSSWPVGEEIILGSWSDIKGRYKDSFLIIVPHEIDVEHIYKIEAVCQENNLCYQVYSELRKGSIKEGCEVLIIDKIGILSAIYSLASIAYVGGGFGKAGLHSVLEPAAYGLPVLFGPNLSKSPEAKEMTDIGCGIAFDNSSELYQIVKSLWGNKIYYNQVSQQSKNFIQKKSGATERIYNIITNGI
ncbi:MAG: hypothetical protein CR982_03100 [Candidatus Cloacimonadota bacterium]|nr:MAG: hypothetical protein CR982_03100 [Candidatus Cloacimonadota bacterium]PIE77437.1 MAG: hypothetical protein CSA15_13235 [Candidatus Delongbacteria bacterium]